jgi:hypothetical protein
MADPVIHKCSEAEEIAQELIPRHHPHLAEARILYLISDQNKKSYGRAVGGDCRRLTGMNRYLSSGTSDDFEEGYDFVVTVYEPTWEELDGRGRTALIDHELMHAWYVEKEDAEGEVIKSWRIRGHDIEEFRDVIARNGLWYLELREFAKVAKQATLEGFERS